jgi:hypothetical protein
MPRGAISLSPHQDGCEEAVAKNSMMLTPVCILPPELDGSDSHRVRATTARSRCRSISRRELVSGSITIAVDWIAELQIAVLAASPATMQTVHRPNAAKDILDRL